MAGLPLRLRRWFGVGTLHFLVLFALLMAIGPATLFRDPGTFWHQRAGDVMLETGRAITTDSFSAGLRGRPWLAHAWVAECAQALLVRLGGFDALLVATAASLAAFFAWAAQRLALAGLQGPVVALVVAMAMAASSFQFLARPLLLSIFATGWIVARLSDVEEGRHAPRCLFALLPLLVLWTNVHGAVLGGLVTIAMALGGWVGLAALRRCGVPLPWPTPVEDARRFAILALFGVLAALTVFVNPYGAGLVRQWTAVVDSPVIARLMVEHAPLRLSDPAGAAVLAFGALYVAALAGVHWTQMRVTWLLPLVWLAMACSRIRHAPLFVATAVAVLPAMLPHVRWIDRLADRGSQLLRRRGPFAPVGMRAAVAPAAMVAATLLLQHARVPLPVFGSSWMQWDAGYWPVAMLPDLDDYARTHPPGTPIFNEMLFGGFLIHFVPRLAVFIDDRCELYGDERLREYEAALLGDRTVITRWLQGPDFGLALVIPGSSFDAWLRSSTDWRVVRETSSAVLFGRADAGRSVEAAR